MAKETKDIYLAGTKLAVSTVKAFEDNKFEPLTDIAQYFDDIPFLQEAFKDGNLAPSEWPYMTTAEREDIIAGVNQILNSELGEVADSQDVRDIVAMVNGLQAAANFTARKLAARNSA